MKPILEFPEVLLPAELRHSDTLAWLYAEDWLGDALGEWAIEHEASAMQASVEPGNGRYLHDSNVLIDEAFLSPGIAAVDRAAAMFCEALCRGSRPMPLAAEDVRWARGMGVAVLGPSARPLSLSDCCATSLVGRHLLSPTEARLWRAIGQMFPGSRRACSTPCDPMPGAPVAAQRRLGRMVRMKARLPPISATPVVPTLAEGCMP